MADRVDIVNRLQLLDQRMLEVQNIYWNFKKVLGSQERWIAAA